MTTNSAARKTPDVIELATTPVHLGLGATAFPLPDFAWTPEALEAYDRRFAADGAEGRMVLWTPTSEGAWPSWERHPAGEELVTVLAGRARLTQWVNGQERTWTLQAGQGLVNPAGVWHTSSVLEAGHMLFITPGKGTEHCPVEHFPPVDPERVPAED